MAIFTQLHALRARQKKTLPFLQTRMDLDIVLELGRAQELGRVMGTNGLIAANLGPSATISRRLARLTRLGIVLERRVLDDRRKRPLVVHASVSTNLKKLLRSCRRIPTA